MPKNTYQSLLKELQEINKRVAQLNKNVKSVKTKIFKKGDEAKLVKTREKISRT